jgi:hypothetical protein
MRSGRAWATFRVAVQGWARSAHAEMPTRAAPALDSMQRVVVAPPTRWIRTDQALPLELARSTRLGKYDSNVDSAETRARTRRRRIPMQRDDDLRWLLVSAHVKALRVRSAAFDLGRARRPGAPPWATRSTGKNEADPCHLVALVMMRRGVPQRRRTSSSCASGARAMSPRARRCSIATLRPCIRFFVDVESMRPTTSLNKPCWSVSRISRASPMRRASVRASSGWLAINSAPTAGS